jgi:hypothetical protein
VSNPFLLAISGFITSVNERWERRSSVPLAGTHSAITATRYEYIGSIR